MKTPASNATKIRRTRAQWQAILSEYEQSGLRAQDFCQQRSLAYSSFAKWRSQLNPAKPKPPEPVSFVPMPPLSASDSHWTIELDLGSGVTLRFRPS